MRVSLPPQTTILVFLQRQTSHKPLLTIVALPGPVPVVLAGVHVHGVHSDELHAAGGALQLTVSRAEGGPLVLLEKMFISGVVGGDVLLQDVEPGEAHVAEGAGVPHPGVLLPQVALEVLD